MNKETQLLRKLACEYNQISLDEKNGKNIKLHRAVNDLKQIRPTVLIEEVPFHELNFDGSLTLNCEHQVLRQAEDYMRKAIFKWKHFPADMIITPFIPVNKIIRSTGIGIEIVEDTLAADNTNHIISHDYHDQLATEEDLLKLHPPVISYDEEETLKKYNILANTIGDIVPIKLCGENSYSPVWDNISMYRGVMNLLIDLAERPEFTHKIVSMLTDFEISKSAQLEKLGLYELMPYQIHATSAFTSDLPSTTFEGGAAKRSDIWGRGMAQIFASVSKSMHEEFEIEYMKKIMEPFGLVYYGCCEPLDKKIDIVEKLPHLRKISITPWADVDIAAQAIGKKYVLASKPNPSAVATTLDEDALKSEIRRTLDACKRNNCNCDIVLKDISSARYSLKNLVRWEQIVMQMVQE